MAESAKASSYSSRILDGRTIVSAFVPARARFPMDVTVHPSIFAGIARVPSSLPVYPVIFTAFPDFSYSKSEADASFAQMQ